MAGSVSLESVSSPPEALRNNQCFAARRQVFAWGSPAGGRLGARPERWLLNSGRQSEPRLVRGLVGIKAWTVQCGHQHSGARRHGREECGLTESGPHVRFDFGQRIMLETGSCQLSTR